MNTKVILDCIAELETRRGQIDAIIAGLRYFADQDPVAEAPVAALAERGPRSPTAATTPRRTARRTVPTGRDVSPKRPPSEPSGNGAFRQAKGGGISNTERAYNLLSGSATSLTAAQVAEKLAITPKEAYACLFRIGKKHSLGKETLGKQVAFALSHRRGPTAQEKLHAQIRSDLPPRRPDPLDNIEVPRELAGHGG